MSIADANLYVVPVSGTSLHRTLVFLNDKTAPLQIAEAKSLFQGKRGAEPTTSTLVDHQIDMQVKASQPVAAVRARIVYFDTFDAQLQTQPFSWQRDLRPGETQTLTFSGKVDTGRFASLLTTVVYFDEIRMMDGTLWVANTREVANQFRSLRLDAQPTP